MGMYKVTNFMMLTEDYDGYMDTEGMLKNGVGSVMDVRTKLPDDFIKRERMDLARAQIYYNSQPLDPKSYGPFMLMQQVCYGVFGDMQYGQRVAIHQNAGQAMNSFLGCLILMKLGMDAKTAYAMITGAVDVNTGEQKGDDLSDDQKKFLNVYGEYLLQKPFMKDPNEEMAKIREMMDKMSPATAKLNQEAVVALARQENFLLGKSVESRTTAKKAGCGCGGGH